MKYPPYHPPRSSADRVGQTRRSIGWHLFGWSAAAFFLVGADLAAQERGGVGRCASAAASILRRATGDKHWKAVQAREALQSGDLLVALPGAVVDSKNGAVRLSLLEDLAGQSLYPVIETAVMLHDGKGVDLEFTLDRGRVTIANRKERGSAQVRVRLRDHTWELTLAEPGARVALEIYGRWPAGSRFARDAKTKEAPAADVVVLVLEGQVDLRAGNQEQALRAPPGPAYFHWDSTAGLDATPGRLEKVPDWADPKAENTPRSRQIRARAEMLRQRLLQESLENALAEAAQSGDTTHRRIAVYLYGAVDDLPHLIAALDDAGRSDVRDTAVVALRHWIGRGSGQDMRLYDALVKSTGYRPVDAEIVLQLLHGFDEQDRKRPETYESLIAYLRSERLPIRELAAWHLQRLAPAGKDIAYDAGASVAERDKGYRAWKQLIPEGKLPPKKSKPNSGEQ